MSIYFPEQFRRHSFSFLSISFEWKSFTHSRKHISTTLSPVLHREGKQGGEHRDVLRLHSIHSPVNLRLVRSTQRSPIHSIC